MFEVTIGEEGLDQTHQGEFPKVIECTHCDGEARVGFVVLEIPKEPWTIEQEFVCNLHPNDPDGEGYWLHDCCAVAVYFCKKCFTPVALYNQG